jgi:hypothetical protein
MACPGCLVAVAGPDDVSTSEGSSTARLAKGAAIFGGGVIAGIVVATVFALRDAEKMLSERRGYARNRRKRYRRNCGCGGH